LRLVVHDPCLLSVERGTKLFKKKADTLCSSPSQTVHLSDDEA